MTSQTPNYHGYRFPPEIISHAVWLYHRAPQQAVWKARRRRRSGAGFKPPCGSRIPYQAAAGHCTRSRQ